MNKEATLERDLEMLQWGEPGCTSDEPALGFEMRMAVVYRSEKKKILRSQINLIGKVLQILKNCEETLMNPEETDKSRAYTELCLKETKIEQEWKESVITNN